MKLSDKTTVNTLREMIGKKVRVRTSRALIKISNIELDEDETWFVGYEGSTKRRIKLGWITELVEEKDGEESKKSSKPSQQFKEARLRKAEEAEAKKDLKDKRRQFQLDYDWTSGEPPELPHSQF